MSDTRHTITASNSTPVLLARLQECRRLHAELEASGRASMDRNEDESAHLTWQRADEYRREAESIERRLREGVPMTATDPAATVAAALAAPFKPHQLSWKPQVVRDNRALAVPHLDARDVMNRLDKAVGMANWHDAYDVLPGGAVVCKLSVRVGGEWITKSDVGGQSDQPDEHDRVKAGFSDALKRAAVKFGVGRYLYYLPKVWADYDPKAKAIVESSLPALPSWALPTPEAKANGH